MNKGFTLIELVVVIAIIAVLSGIILFSVTLYINKGKDSNLSGNLSILVPAGEVLYNNNNNSYGGFCDPTQPTGSVLENIIKQMPDNPTGDCTTNTAGICCYVASDGQSWAACAQEFADNSKAYCVDSRGVKEEICNLFCNNTSPISVCPDTTSCP